MPPLQLFKSIYLKKDQICKSWNIYLHTCIDKLYHYCPMAKRNTWKRSQYSINNR